MPQYLETGPDGLSITAEGITRLKRVVTDTAGGIYAFLPEANPLAASAAMARLSRSADDMRAIYLNEFADQDRGIDDLIRRVVTQYGDDSVQQLMFLQVTVEGASNLATKQLELGRLMAYLEQSTRYIFFDRKVNGRYRYLVPSYLDDKTRDLYTRVMDGIFDRYSAMVRALTAHVRAAKPYAYDATNPATEQEQRQAWLNATRAQACDAARPVLPAATKSTVGIVGTVQAFDNLVMRLLSEELPEFLAIGKGILEQVRKACPVFFERTDLPDRGGAKSKYRQENRHRMRGLVDQLGLREQIDSDANYSDDRDAEVSLLGYTPADELDIAADCLYEFARDTPYLYLKHRVDRLPRSDKEAILRAYIGERLNRRHKPGRAFENPHYTWEVIGDYGTFRDLQRHRMVDDMSWQELTPNWGYSVPGLVREAGLEGDFRRCFDESAMLYRAMYKASYRTAAQYAVLLGHHVAYKFSCNAREAYHLHELRTTPQGHPGYRKIVQAMHKKLRAVHPTIGSGMRFVGMNDSPELTRLDSELVIATKLAGLDKSGR